MIATISTKPAGIATGCPDIGAYIACLASYNSGILHGAWVDLEEVGDVDDIQDCINWVMATSSEPGSEEYAVHDYAGLPGYLTDSEWPDLAALIEYKEARAEVMDSGYLVKIEAFELLCEDRRATVSVRELEESFCGFYTSGAEYAQELAFDTGAFNESMKWPLDCIDWDQAFEALEMNTCRANGGLYVFNNF